MLCGAGGRIRTCVAVRRRIYSPLELATLPPLQGSPRAWSPRGDSNPLTYRLQIGCAAIAPLGPTLTTTPFDVLTAVRIVERTERTPDIRSAHRQRLYRGRSAGQRGYARNFAICRGVTPRSTSAFPRRCLRVTHAAPPAHRESGPTARSHAHRARRCAAPRGHPPSRSRQSRCTPR